MKAGRIVWSIVGLLSLSAATRAGPVLIGSFDGEVANGRVDASDPLAKLGLVFLSSLPKDQVGGFENIISSDSFMQHEEGGTFDFMPGVTNGFDRLAAIATNGLDDRVAIFVIWPDFGPAGVAGNYESFFFDRDIQAGDFPDLVGYRLDFIRLVVDEARFESFPDDGPEGLVAAFEFRYEFFGSEIPEPETLALLALGMLVL